MYRYDKKFVVANIIRYCVLCSVMTMALTKLENITLSDFTWLNEPSKWKVTNNVLHLTTDNETDFWQETYYHFKHNSGHVFGVKLNQNFTFTVSVTFLLYAYVTIIDYYLFALFGFTLTLIINLLVSYYPKIKATLDTFFCRICASCFFYFDFVFNPF